MDMLPLILNVRLIHASFEDSGTICLMVENFIFGIFPSPVKIAGKYTHITLATATQYLDTHHRYIHKHDIYTNRIFRLSVHRHHHFTVNKM